MTKRIDLRGIRISIDESVHPFYEDFVSRSAGRVEDYPFATMKDVFMVAACVGAKYDQYKEIKKSRGVFSGDVFDPDFEVPILCAIAFKKFSDVEDLFDIEQMIRHCQNYANAGICILQHKIETSVGLGKLYRVAEVLRNVEK